MRRRHCGHRINISSAVTALTSTSSAFDSSATGVDEAIRWQALADEEAALEHLKVGRGAGRGERSGGGGCAPNSQRSRSDQMCFDALVLVAAVWG